MSEIIGAVAEVGSSGGVLLSVVAVSNAVLLVEKSLVLTFTITVPRCQSPLSHPLLSAVPGPLGLALVDVST